MFTKLALTFGLVFGLALGGCSGQNDAYSTTPVVTLSGAGCLAQAPTALENFLNAQSTAAQITRMWSCLSYALNEFSTYVDGQNKNYYTGNELREFLESYFLQGMKPQPGQAHLITDNFLKEILQIKALFLGGTNSVLTRTEINNAFALLNNFNGITLGLLPHANILFGDKSKLGVPISVDTDQALDSVNASAGQLVHMLDVNHPVYQFADLSLFLHELYLYIQNQNPKTTFKDYSSYVPLLVQIKGLLMDSDRTKISGTEWLALGPFMSQAYAIFLRGSFYLGADSLVSVDPLTELRALVLDFTQVLHQGIAQHNGNPLALADVDAIIDAAATLNMLPAGIAVDDIKNLIGRIVDSILNPQNAYSQSGISTQKLDYFESQIDDWEMVQKALVMNIELPGNTSWVQMQRVIDGPWPLREDQYGRVILDGNPKVSPNLASNSRLNWARALVSILYQAYITDPSRRNSMELSRAELHTAFLDLRPALVFLGLINSTNATFDVSLFREANLFMPRSNGDNYLQFDELIEYIHLVYGGIDAGHLLVDALPASCMASSSTVDVTCWRTNFRKSAAFTLGHMPLQVSYLSGLSDRQWSSYIQYLEVINRPEGAVATPISTSAIYESYVLLQYVEDLMLRYDPNHTGKIGIVGCFKMLDLFIDTIAQALNLDPVGDRAEIEAFYTYILHYGSPPDPKDPISQLRYSNWKLQRSSWQFGVDRSNILDVLAILTKLGL